MRHFIPYRAGNKPHEPRVRSKNGCRACLAKRVKCDEVQPTCGRCAKAKIRCPGPRSASERTKAVASSSTSSKSVSGGDSKASPSSSNSNVEPSPPLSPNQSKAASEPRSPPVPLAPKSPSSFNAKSPNSTSSKTESIIREHSPGEAEPILLNGHLDPILLKHVPTGMHTSQLEGETLDRFVRRFVPCMGIFMDAAYFQNLVLPATQGNSQIFNGALAVTTFCDLPMTDVWTHMPAQTYKRYQAAIKWYRKSIKQSMESPPDSTPQSLAMSLLMITIYLGIEQRQINWQAQEGLIKASFSIIFSGRNVIRKSRNAQILMLIGLLMDFACVQAINVVNIPRQQWNTAYDLVQQLCVDCEGNENIRIRSGLYRILYDVNTILHRGHGSSFELECRMQSWLADLNRYETSLPMDFRARIPALRCRFLFSQLQIAWESYLYGKDIDRNDHNARLSRILNIHEINEVNTRKVPHRPSWILETAIIPSCIWIAWYWRSQQAHARIKALFERNQDSNIPEQVRLVRLAVEYIGELVDTPYDKPSSIERETFGGQPRVLQHYQAFRLLDYLVRKHG